MTEQMTRRVRRREDRREARWSAGAYYLYSTFICSPASPRRTLDGGPIHAAPMRPSASVSLSSCQTSLGRLAGAHVTLSDWRGGTSDRHGVYVPLLVCRRLALPWLRREFKDAWDTVALGTWQRLCPALVHHRICILELISD